MATGQGSARIWRIIALDALLLGVASATLGLVVNALRPGGLPLIAATPYGILVPCPETLGEVEALELSALALDPVTDLIIDARDAQAHAAWHVDGAVNVTFDVLEPVPPAVVQNLLQRPARRAVVYGDVEDELDQGYELARELSGRGLRNVSFVRGDSAALRAHLRAGASP